MAEKVFENNRVEEAAAVIAGELRKFLMETEDEPRLEKRPHASRDVARRLVWSRSSCPK